MAPIPPIPPSSFSAGTICLGGSAADAPIEVTRCYGLQRPNGLSILLSIAIERLGQTSRKGAAVFLDYFALGVPVFVVVTLFYAVIAIHDIPHLMAKARNHPHQDAIHVAGWVSLFTLHAIWPFLFIWATIYREDRGWGIRNDGKLSPEAETNAEIARLHARIVEIEAQTPERENA